MSTSLIASSATRFVRVLPAVNETNITEPEAFG
jgi:hypothetical protein